MCQDKCDVLQSRTKVVVKGAYLLLFFLRHDYGVCFTAIKAL